MIFSRRVERVFLYPAQVEYVLLGTSEYPEVILGSIVNNNMPDSLGVRGWKEVKFDTEPMPGDKNTSPNSPSAE